jgi:glycosyltransferase family protein
MEVLKRFVWILINLLPYNYSYWQTRKIRRKLNILNSEETIKIIISSHCSVSRYGDGELQMINHYLVNGNATNFNVDTFQQYNVKLAERLIEVYKSSNDNCLISLPYDFKDASGNKLYTRLFWEREWLGRYKMLDSLSLEKLFGDTNFTRFYMNRKDIKDYVYYISLLKKIWEKREIIIVEGELSRLGVGDDLFDNAKQIERILCPSVNAFDKYNQILNAVKEMQKEKLILIALGHTATVLAYDLSTCGYCAIDVGHIDVEYEWYLMKAKCKVAVPNKYVNEVRAGRIDSGCNNIIYRSQIVKIIF